MFTSTDTPQSCDLTPTSIALLQTSNALMRVYTHVCMHIYMHICTYKT